MHFYTKFPIFSSDFKQIWIYSKEFRRSPRYQILRKSVQWELRYYMQSDGRTDRHDECNRRFWRLMRTRLKRPNLNCDSLSHSAEILWLRRENI